MCATSAAFGCAAAARMLMNRACKEFMPWAIVGFALNLVSVGARRGLAGLVQGG